MFLRSINSGTCLGQAANLVFILIVYIFHIHSFEEGKKALNRLRSMIELYHKMQFNNYLSLCAIESVSATVPVKTKALEI